MPLGSAAAGPIRSRISTPSSPASNTASGTNTSRSASGGAGQVDSRVSRQLSVSPWCRVCSGVSEGDTVAHPASPPATAMSSGRTAVSFGHRRAISTPP